MGPQTVGWLQSFPSLDTRDSHLRYFLGSLGREAEEYGMMLQAKGYQF